MNERSIEQDLRARIEELEQALGQAKADTERLRKEVARAEQKGSSIHKMASEAARAASVAKPKEPLTEAGQRWSWAKWWFIFGLWPAALAYCFATGLAMADIDSPGWPLANASFAFSILGPALGWWRAGHGVVGALGAAAKLGVWAQVGSGWWALAFARVPIDSHPKAISFFWLAPFCALVAGLLEAAAASFWARHVEAPRSKLSSH